MPARAQRLANGDVNTTAPGLPRRANEMTGPSGTVAWGTCAPTPAENAGGWDWSDRRLEREYVWAADSSAYVDECVAQLVYTNAHEPAAGSISAQAAYNGDDTSATVLYVLADHNANVIGLTDDRGRLVGQYAYTPYGELRASEYFTPDSGSLASAEAVVAAKGNVLGHQGLRTERFDRPWDGALDVDTAAITANAAATGAYRALNHNRNRMYDPAAGRFIEQDPNGLGGMLLENMAFGGHGINACDVDVSLEDHFTDGMNTHAALGSNPRMRQDASGLLFGWNSWDEWWRDGKEGAGLLFNGAQTFLSFTDVHGLVQNVAEALLDNYSMNLEADTDWATDWSMPDDAHTRTSNKWVAQAMLLGAYKQFNLHYWAETFGMTGGAGVRLDRPWPE